MVGYLVYAAWVEPFVRPFFSALSSAIVRNEPNRVITRSKYMSMAINVSILILEANRGISFQYILNKMPRASGLLTLHPLGESGVVVESTIL